MPAFKTFAACMKWAAAALSTTLAVAEESPDAKLPADLQLVRLSVEPAELTLANPYASAQLVITGVAADGQSYDLTRAAEPVSGSDLVEVDARRLVQPVGENGSAQLTFRYGGQEATVAVRITGQDGGGDVSFVQQVQPALSKMGCNMGTCHGSAKGQNGFKLSLRGYDAVYDHRALTDDLGGRRFNRSAPAQSLMLLKATGAVPHVGGVRTTEKHAYYKLLRRWIASGVALDLDASRVTAVEVFPKNPIVPLPGMKQQFRVLATYSDGSRRDVTRESFIESGDIERLEADEHGLVTTLRRGEAPILVRYEGQYASTIVTVMGDRSGFVWEQPPTNNYIDEHIYDKLQRVKIGPSGLCGDSEFVRRIYLDLTGLPPTSDQVRAFLDDPRPTREKRDALIDQLVGSPEFIEQWTNKWADLLQVNRKHLGVEGSVALRKWIRESVANNKPYDQFAKEVLTATGSNLQNPPASYWKTLREPTETMENTTHLFLAIRFNCNKCHDHPFERWTQDQYYELSAFFAQVGLKPDPDPRYAKKKIGGTAVEGAKPLVEIIFDKPNGEVKHERTGEVAKPQFPFEYEGMPQPEGTRREQLAAWIASRDNPYFARSYVNRLWGYLFGRGLIEPIDDIRAGNPPTHPALLDALERDFIESGFDVRHIFKVICKSRTYQHSVSTNDWNADDEVNYSHAVPRRLPAETLYDAIHVACGAPQRLPGVPVGTRAAELPDAGVSAPFLDDFGRPVRESACECERSSGVVLGPIMKLVSGPTLDNAIKDPNNALAKLVREQPDDRKLIEELFLRFLARYPTEEEIQIGLEALKGPAVERETAAAALARYDAETLPARQAEWEASQQRMATWETLVLDEQKSTNQASKFTKQEDGSVVVSGKPAKEDYTLTAKAVLDGLTGLKLEAMPDDSLAAKGPGRAHNGNFVLSEMTLEAAPADQPDQFKSIALRNASATFEQNGLPAASAIDGQLNTGWAIHPRMGQPNTLLVETAEDLRGEYILRITLRHHYPDGEHALGRFRLSTTTMARPIQVKGLDPELLAIVKTPPAERSEPQSQRLRQHFLSIDSQRQELAAMVADLQSRAGQDRLLGVQDLAWALVNNPAFLFNR